MRRTVVPVGFDWVGGIHNTPPFATARSSHFSADVDKSLPDKSSITTACPFLGKSHSNLACCLFVIAHELSTEQVTRPRGFFDMTIQPARQECHTCCPQQAGKNGIRPVVGNMHGIRVERAALSLPKILRDSELIREFENKIDFNTIFTVTK